MTGTATGDEASVLGGTSSSKSITSIPFSSLCASPAVMLLTARALDEKKDAQPSLFAEIVDSIGFECSGARNTDMGAGISMDGAAGSSGRAKASSLTISDSVFNPVPDAEADPSSLGGRDGAAPYHPHG
jgi:hypothetical protein